MTFTETEENNEFKDFKQLMLDYWDRTFKFCIYKEKRFTNSRCCTWNYLEEVNI